MWHLHVENGWEEWRDLARLAVRRDVPPDELQWTDARDPQHTLFSGDSGGSAGRSDDDRDELGAEDATRNRPRVPKKFVSWGRDASYHADPERWEVLYRILWRLAGDEPGLLERQTDDRVGRLRSMYKAVKRDAHKMKAFVRFREVDGAEHESFVAWHDPDHYVVPRVGPFFADRFSSMHWTIFTPHASATWDGESLEYGPGIDRSEAPEGDDLESMWRTYYGAIFNPARVKTEAMRSEMPVKHWSTLPETADIPELLREAPSRVEEMNARAAETIEADVSGKLDWEELESQCRECRACDRCETARQVVFGEGDRSADVAVVGEQPGAEEDRRGRPFVGPAGSVLDRALDEAGLDRDELYLTNTVKHYGFEERDGDHIHDSPDAYVVETCQPWLDAELSLLSPNTVVALGRTAASALAGRQVSIGREHGRRLRGGKYADAVVPTYHPAAVLRQPGDLAASTKFRALVEDLRRAAA